MFTNEMIIDGLNAGFDNVFIPKIIESHIISESVYVNFIRNANTEKCNFANTFKRQNMRIVKIFKHIIFC